MPADEFLGWEEHFKYYPPTTLGVEKLLAMMIAIKCSSKEKKYTEYDIAPWLLNPLMEKELRKKKQQQSINQVGEIYKQMKKG